MRRRNFTGRLFAGLCAALISPAAIYGLNIGGLKNPAVRRSSPNNGSLILYRPDENGAVETVNIEDADVSGDLEKLGDSDGSKTAVSVLSRNISGEYEDLSVFSANDGSIGVMTFTPGVGVSYIDLAKAGQVRNRTEIPNSVLASESSLLPDFVPEKNGEPQVLIIHTHTSESYQPNDSGHYDTGYTSRSTDPEKNVVAVGAKAAEAIAKRGYAVIHDGTVHDYQYNGAYERSAETVKTILAQYPSIKVVLDVHRDAITENKAPVAAVTRVNGADAAQIMIISAADDGSGEYENPHFLKNFRFACLLQSQSESDYPGLMRPALIQYCGYNQNLSTGSLLVEIGSHGNTLEQALYAGELFGDSVGRALDSINNEQ